MVKVGDRVQLTVPSGLISPLSLAGDHGLSGIVTGYFRIVDLEETVLRLRLDHPFKYHGREYSFIAMLGRERGETWCADSGRCNVYLVNVRSLLAVSREGLGAGFVPLDRNAEYRIV